MQRNPFFAALVTVFAAASIPCWAGTTGTNSLQLTILGTATADGYTFLNFNGPNGGTNAGAGTNMNGISNTGVAVGFDIDNNGGFHNYTANPYTQFGSALSINGSVTAMAFGVNSAGDVVGTDGNGNAFVLPRGGSVETFIPGGGSAATAFGINDKGSIVGQYTASNGQMPGFLVSNSAGAGLVRIDSPTGPDTVNAQGINNNGQIVGFYVGTDGQDHGFTANSAQAKSGQITGTAVADPTLPTIPGEPGATFVFSQILGVNDQGLAVGYFGDSTTSQHGFIYNLTTDTYTFLDDPSEAFNNGVEVTQITGINNLDEITGFYSDANGVFHGFVACPVGVTCPTTNPSAVPEPSSVLLAGFGFIALGFGCARRRRALRGVRG